MSISSLGARVTGASESRQQRVRLRSGLRFGDLFFYESESATREDDEAEAAEAEGYTCGLKDNGEYMCGRV